MSATCPQSARAATLSEEKGKEMTTITRTAGKTVILAVVLTVPAMPASADGLEDWLAGEHAGNWGGTRDTLEEAGITFERGYTTDLLTLARGGENGGEGWSYAGGLELGIAFDLEKLTGLSGASIFANAAWSSGQDLSDKDVGNVFTVAQIFDGQAVRLGELYYQQKLFDDELTFKIGRLITEEDFLASHIYENYVNGGINGTPSAVPGQQPRLYHSALRTMGYRFGLRAKQAITHRNRLL
jgi:porin